MGVLFLASPHGNRSLRLAWVGAKSSRTLSCYFRPGWIWAMVSGWEPRCLFLIIKSFMVLGLAASAISLRDVIRIMYLLLVEFCRATLFPWPKTFFKGTNRPDTRHPAPSWALRTRMGLSYPVVNTLLEFGPFGLMHGDYFTLVYVRLRIIKLPS